MTLEKNYRSREQEPIKEAQSSLEGLKNEIKNSVKDTIDKDVQKKNIENIRLEEKSDRRRTEKMAARLLSQIKKEDITPAQKQEESISYTPQKVASFMQQTKDDAKERGYDMSRFSLNQFA